VRAGAHFSVLVSVSTRTPFHVANLAAHPGHLPSSSSVASSKAATHACYAHSHTRPTMSMGCLFGLSRLRLLSPCRSVSGHRVDGRDVPGRAHDDCVTPPPRCALIHRPPPCPFAYGATYARRQPLPCTLSDLTPIFPSLLFYSLPPPSTLPSPFPAFAPFFPRFFWPPPPAPTPVRDGARGRRSSDSCLCGCCLRPRS